MKKAELNKVLKKEFPEAEITIKAYKGDLMVYPVNSFTRDQFLAIKYFCLKLQSLRNISQDLDPVYEGQSIVVYSS